MRCLTLLVENDFEVKKLTSFKIGGVVRRVIFPESIEEFVASLESCPEAFVFGNMSNVLVSSDGFDGTLILTTKMKNYDIKENLVTSECGIKGPKLSQIVAEKGLSGLEFMIAFPGSIGGEVFMNAGAHGQSVQDVFVEGDFFDKTTRQVVTLTKKDMNFSYRTSVCQKRELVVLNSTFELVKKDAELIKAKMQENLEFRHSHQPSLALPNCGSVFRNPEGDSAGRLLEAVGAKLFKIGGVKVWEGHANFIINENNATSMDVLELMLKMQNKVKEKYNIELMPEVRYLGNNSRKEEDICKILYQSLTKVQK